MVGESLQRLGRVVEKFTDRKLGRNPVFPEVKLTRPNRNPPNSLPWSPQTNQKDPYYEDGESEEGGSPDYGQPEYDTSEYGDSGKDYVQSGDYHSQELALPSERFSSEDNEFDRLNDADEFLLPPVKEQEPSDQENSDRFMRPLKGIPKWVPKTGIPKEELLIPEDVEGMLEGRQGGRPEGKPEVRPEVRPEERQEGPPLNLPSDILEKKKAQVLALQNLSKLKAMLHMASEERRTKQHKREEARRQFLSLVGDELQLMSSAKAAQLAASQAYRNLVEKEKDLAQSDMNIHSLRERENELYEDLTMAEAALAEADFNYIPRITSPNELKHFASYLNFGAK